MKVILEISEISATALFVRHFHSHPIVIDLPPAFCFCSGVRTLHFIFSLLLVAEGSLFAQVGEVPSAPSLRGGEEPVAMKPVFRPGMTYRFISENLIRMQLPGQGIREATVEQQTRFDAAIRPDGRAGVQVTARIERLKVDFRSGENQVVYDSFREEDRSSLLGQHFRNSLNRRVELKMNEALEILEVTYAGPEGLGTLLPGVPQFGLNEVEKLAAEIPQGLPQGAVRPGESWALAGTREFEEVGELQFDLNHRYAGMAEQEGTLCHEILMTGELSGDSRIPPAGGALAGSRMIFRGTSLSGRILFDSAAGTVRLREHSVSMLMELPAQGGGDPFQIPLEQQSGIRLLHVVPTP